jgi:site-specific DNA-methyltransferase (adenine-specific)
MLLKGDCLELLRGLPDCSVDSVVTDPPYELGFMGKRWDASGVAYNVELWGECLRVLKPGGHLLAFGGTRTYHRMVVAIEDAGFEIRDSIHWIYGSGFPKSLDVSKAIDKQAGAEREVVSTVFRGERAGVSSGIKGTPVPRTDTVTAPATAEAERWSGWGTALKPAHEPVVVARKPLMGTVAGNVLGWGVGGLNIDGCRVATDDNLNGGTFGGVFGTGKPTIDKPIGTGRWPANVVHDGSPEVCDRFPTTGPSKAAPRGGTNPNPMDWGNARSDGDVVKGHTDDGGSASRFFAGLGWGDVDEGSFLYFAKAGKRERNAGLDEMPERQGGSYQGREDGSLGQKTKPSANVHPTVKPIALMRWLVRLVTPPDGTVLDPFLGSGTTAVAATLEGVKWVGCEMTEDYWPIIEGRVLWAEGQRGLL